MRNYMRYTNIEKSEIDKNKNNKKLKYWQKNQVKVHNENIFCKTVIGKK